MKAGRYTIRSNWKSRSIGDGFLAAAVIEVEETGSIFVHVDGEPLFAFAHAEAFFGAHSLAHEDLERTRAFKPSRKPLPPGDLFA